MAAAQGTKRAQLAASAAVDPIQYTAAIAYVHTVLTNLQHWLQEHSHVGTAAVPELRQTHHQQRHPKLDWELLLLVQPAFYGWVPQVGVIWEVQPVRVTAGTQGTDMGVLAPKHTWGRTVCCAAGSLAVCCRCSQHTSTRLKLLTCPLRVSGCLAR